MITSTFSPSGRLLKRQVLLSHARSKGHLHILRAPGTHGGTISPLTVTTGLSSAWTQRDKAHRSLLSVETVFLLVPSLPRDRRSLTRYSMGGKAVCLAFGL